MGILERQNTAVGRPRSGDTQVQMVLKIRIRIGNSSPFQLLSWKEYLRMVPNDFSLFKIKNIICLCSCQLGNAFSKGVRRGIYHHFLQHSPEMSLTHFWLRSPGQGNVTSSICVDDMLKKIHSANRWARLHG
jgi:hypothetical protein